MTASLANETDEARAIVLTLHESAKTCTPEQDGLQFRLMRAAGALDRWVHLCGRAYQRIDQLEMQVAALQALVLHPTEQSKATERREQIKSGIGDELGRLHKTNALLIAAQFAANHEAEFDVSDAIAAIIERVDQHIETLDELCREASQ